MSESRPRLLFVSPRFLFPVDSGGKIRTTQILRGLTGGHFDLTLLSPAPATARSQFAAELASVCDRFVSWPQDGGGNVYAQYQRVRALLSPLPIPVATDRSRDGQRLVSEELGQRPDVVVFDFPHSAVLAPPQLDVPSVLFTHNVEAEIFRRHANVANNVFSRTLWSNQAAKMEAFETDCLRRFDRIVAVAERDRQAFAERAGIDNVTVIPTGVDLEFFAHAAPGDSGNVVFTGSMDWLANIDGIRFMLDSVWPRLHEQVPGICMNVVGRAPPAALVDDATRRYSGWRFTGFVDDIRPHVHAASIFVIPLRVGGGTRLKVYEAMAMGCPVVSTTIGVEGLPVEHDTHYLRADTPAELAAAIARLNADAALRERLSRAARELVQRNFSFQAAAAVFEDACRDAMRAPASERTAAARTASNT